MTRGIGLAVLALLLAMPTAAGAAGRSARTGVLHGIVSNGPICSGQPQPCVPVPDAKIVFVRHGKRVAQTTSGDFGTYKVRLAAGTYGIKMPGRSTWQPGRVRVRRGQATRVNITVSGTTN